MLIETLEPAIALSAAAPQAVGDLPAANSSTSSWSLFTRPGVYFLLKWFHFMAGITWIGILYYFNFVQTPYFKGGAPKDVVNAMTRGMVPNALWWFRWGAMLTFLTGWAMIMMKAHGDKVPWEAPWMTRILTGGILGTLMWFNVWFIIWPAQKVVIASAEKVAAGAEALPDAAGRAARAGLASRTNTLFSIPMLFFMGAASNLQAASVDPGNVMTYWIVAGLVILLFEINCLIGPGAATQKPLGSVVGTVHFGVILAAILYVLVEIF